MVQVCCAKKELEKGGKTETFPFSNYNNETSSVQT
jgi:hypothetical protein